MAIRYLKRAFVSAALPNPVYWRIVHGWRRNISGWMPRVNGYSPGSPTIDSPPLAATCSAV